MGNQCGIALTKDEEGWRLFLTGLLIVAIYILSFVVPVSTLVGTGSSCEKSKDIESSKLSYRLTGSYSIIACILAIIIIATYHGPLFDCIKDGDPILMKALGGMGIIFIFGMFIMGLLNILIAEIWCTGNTSSSPQKALAKAFKRNEQ